MRMLWAIVAMLLVVGVSVAVLRLGGAGGDAVVQRPASVDAPAAFPAAPAQREAPNTSAQEAAPEAAAPVEERDELDVMLEELLAVEGGEPTGGAEEELFSFTPGEAPAAREGARAERRGTTALPNAPQPTGTGVDRLISMQQGTDLADLLGEPEAAVDAAPREEDEDIEAADGALAVDGGRFQLPGSGTKEDPYRVTWDLLLSANETYRPRQGMNDLPAWTETVDGKWVQLSGFIAYPMFATEVNEVLLMKNQWDGCCMGVPPTPYDAVEVTLAGKSNPKRQTFLYGSVTGRLKVEPYLQGRWLLGLYLMEEATMRLDM